jgi:hypothetical protein
MRPTIENESWANNCICPAGKLMREIGKGILLGNLE